MNRRIKKKLRKHWGYRSYRRVKELKKQRNKSFVPLFRPTFLAILWMDQLEKYHVMDIKPKDTTWTHGMRQHRYRIKGVSSFRYQQIGGYDTKPPSILSFIPYREFYS